MGAKKADVDVNEVLVKKILSRLVYLEHEIRTLRRALEREIPQPGPTRDFKSLKGVWAGIDVSDEEICAAQVEIPDGL